jgi:hypothetical protein
MREEALRGVIEKKIAFSVLSILFSFFYEQSFQKFSLLS